ncbi:MAG: hypothetical protein SFU98_20730 [Leptospiraceae bacterium]|nr:hypothetical protein [Leptospiraceae bacterium]
MKKFFLVFFLFLSTNFLFANSLGFGWEMNPSSNRLFMNGQKVFDSKEQLRNFPVNFGAEEMIQFSLLVGEYYILNGDKDGMSNLVYLIRQEKIDLKLLDNLLSFFWKLERDEREDAERKLEDYIDKETNSYYQKIAKTILEFSTRKKKSNLNLTEIRTQVCTKSKGYYGVCKLLQIRAQLELMAVEPDIAIKEYNFLDRLLASVFEEPEFSYIPFLDRIIPDFASRLAYLGLATEAVYFQKMILGTEKLSGKFEIVSLERFAFYQLLSGDISGAEDTLQFTLRSIKSISVTRNSVLLKLGSLAFLKKDYKTALGYLAELNVKFWGRTLKNPITDEPISTYEARELVALCLWKSKSATLAVKALSKMINPKPDEDDLFIRLRIAQILFKDKPESTEKMTDDIVYLAQSKGWKKVEYAGTLLSGYSLLVNQKYRKSVIQFTKSYGIFGESNPNFVSEWMRQTGMLQARVSGKERGNHISVYRKILNAMAENPVNTDALIMKLYLDSRFSPEEFQKSALQQLISIKDYETVFRFLYHYDLMNRKQNSSTTRTYLQISEVNKRMRFYKGFKPLLDSIYYKGPLRSLKKEMLVQLKKSNESIDFNFLAKTSQSFVAIFHYQDLVYVFSHEPSRNEKYRWNMISFPITEEKSKDYYNKIVSNFAFLDKGENIQIYLNSSGIDLYQHLKRNKISTNVRFFYNFSKEKRSDSDLEIAFPDCGTVIEKKPSNLNFYPIDSFEGLKSFDSQRRVHIWKFSELTSQDSSKIETYKWKCDSKTDLSFAKMQRRLDSRTTPERLVLYSPVFVDSTPEYLTNSFLEFTDFFFRKGVDQILFVDRFENDVYTNDVLNTFSKSSFETSEIQKIHSLLNSKNREHVILSRELK